MKSTKGISKLMLEPLSSTSMSDESKDVGLFRNNPVRPEYQSVLTTKGRLMDKLELTHQQTPTSE